MLRRVAPAAAFAGLILFALTAHLLAETKTVEKPMFNGHRLAWCANWGADCGEPAAEAWCIAQGFAGVETFTKAPGIGDKSPTRLIATGAICDSADCDGFKEITCVKLDPVPPAASAETTAATSPAPEEEPERAVGTIATPNAEPPPLPAAELPEAADAAPETPPSPEVATADTLPEMPPAALEKDAEPDPAVRVIAPGDAPDEAPPAGLDGSVRPVAATAVMAEPDVPEDDPGPQPPDTITLAAAGAPPIRPVLEVFTAPTFNGRRLDWCRGWKDLCGRATADEFCRLQGFEKALAFAPDPGIGATEPTRQIASGLVCDHDGCDGFAEIACTK